MFSRRQISVNIFPGMTATVGGSKRTTVSETSFVAVLGVLIYAYALNLSCLYRVEQEECARLREGVPYVKVYRYNPKHLYPKLNGLGDNGN